MKTRLIATVCGVLATTSLGSAADMPVKAPPRAPNQASAPAWNLTVSGEARYYSWQSDRGFPTRFTPANSGRGSELYVPYAAQLVGSPVDNFKVDLVARGGWVWARQSTAGLTGEVATTTDTVASWTVTYLGLKGIQPFAAVSTNLPTGRSELLGTAANARMDPDLVDIATFGEGFNVGPTAGFNLPISSTLIMTPSAGYTWRNSYDRENSLDALDHPASADPDQSRQCLHRNGFDLLSIRPAGGADHRLPVPANADHRERRSALSGRGALPRRRHVVLLVAGSRGDDPYGFGCAHQSKRRALPGSSRARQGSHEYQFQSIPCRPSASDPGRPGHVRATASFLYRDHNEYDTTTLQFVPAKDRWAAGALVRIGVTDMLTFNARMERVWTHENEDPAPGNLKFSVLANGFVPAFTIPVISSTGWQLVIGSTGRF
jgi:hypothetical protein